MCGIAGLRAYEGSPVDIELAREMSWALHHRGPDDHGEWVSRSVALMHRRLSIIDVMGSPQPMSTPDGRFHLTFNGEILNYRELRGQLDYPFKTDGDTEVVLAVLARLGLEGVGRLRGQFAFACYDSQLGELWLVRDRLGILPLFYARTSSALAFASEIKALLPTLPGGARIAGSSLHAYLRQRAVPAPDTLVEGVVKLRPGEAICFKSTGEQVSSRYWSPPCPTPPWQGDAARRRTWSRRRWRTRCASPWCPTCRWGPTSAVVSTAA